MDISSSSSDRIMHARADHNLHTLHGYAWVVAVAAFFLLLAGSMVTSTDSGDAIPTWPAPAVMPMEGGVFFELGHRYVAAFVGLLTIILAVLVELRGAVLPSSIRKTTRFAAVLVVVMAILGGVRVLVGQSVGDEHVAITVIGIGHGVLGQTFFALTAAAVYLIGRARRGAFELSSERVLDRTFFKATRMAISVLYLQLVLGGLVRFTRPGPVIELVALHVLGAVLVVYAIVELAIKVPRDHAATTGVQRACHFALALLGVQFLLGVVTFFALSHDGSRAQATWTADTLMPSLHFGVGALLLMTAILIHLAIRGRDSVETPA